MAAFVVLASTVVTGFGATTTPVAAVELPPNNENSLFIQTSGPNAGVGIGDWYTAPLASGGGGADHLLDITIPATWPAGLSVTVALYDPELNSDNPTVLLAADEIRGSGADTTNYRLTDPNNIEIANSSYTEFGGTNGAWTELITFIPVAGGGTYALENSTSNDDDNSWRLSVSHDPDCPTGGCTPAQLVDGDEYDDPDGTPGTADEIEVELIRTTFQHAGTGLVCNDFYFYVDGSKPTISLHNFDMDNAGSVIYTLPDGSTENGTVSGSTTWNGSANTTRAGDFFSVDSSRIGWWQAEICLTPNNQYIFEGETDEPVFLEEPPPLPDIELTKTDNVQNTVPGSTLNYLIGYDNVSDDTVSPAPALNVLITDTLAPGTSFVGCSFVSGLTGSCSHSTGVVRWNLTGTLPSGDSGVVGLEVTVDAGAAGTLTNVSDVIWLDAYGRNYAADAATDVDIVVDSDLFITKTSDVLSAGVDAGDVITYTVTVANVGDVVNTGIVITDPVPAGTSYNSESTTADFHEVVSTQSWTDDFSSGGYAGGSINWAGPWEEGGDDNNPANGDVDVPTETGSRRLHLQADDNSVEREIDLSGLASATLSFDMKIVGFDNVDDSVSIEASDDGGSSWTPLDTFFGPLDESTYTRRNFDLTPYIANDTRIRFVTPVGAMQNADDVYIDNLSVLSVVTAPATKSNQASDPTPLDDGTVPNLITAVDNAALAPGQSMTVTYEATVDAQPGVPRIVNIATTSSSESPDELNAAVTDPVLVGSIAGVAFEDKDGGGTNDIVDTGIGSVTVELLDSGGAVLDTTTTNPTGGYRFENLVAGTYAVRFTTPASATITPQDQGGDDTVDSDIDPTTGTTSQVVLAGGVATTDLDAGYVFGSTIGDEVWVDLDGDGTQGGAEPGLADVVVELLNSTGTVVDTTTTEDGSGSNPLGFYQFSSVVPGAYSVRFTAPSGYVFTIPDQVVDSSDSDADRDTGETPQFAVVSGSDVGTVDAGLYQPIVIGDLIWLDLDGDGIQGSGEPGAPGVTVNLLDSGGSQVDTTITAVDGSFSFDVPQPGTFQIEVEAASFAFSPLNQGGNDTVDSDVSPAGLTALFAVASGIDELDIDAGIIPTTLGDTVWLDADADGIQNGPQTGVPGVTVNLRTAAGALISSQTTGLGGSYSFDVGPGDVVVEFITPSGHALSPTNQGSDDDLDSDPDPATGRTATIAITTPTEIDNVDAGLFQAATISDRVWLDRNGDGLQDADTSASGEPGIAGVTVQLLDATGATVIDSTTTADGSGVNPLGHYEFTGVTPASYIVEFVAPPGKIFTTAGVGANDAIDSDAAPASGRTAAVVVGSGVTINNVDAGVFDYATIGDRAWIDADGDGVQDNLDQTGGEVGLAGVTVNLLDAAGTTVVATTTTADGSGADPAGFYQFTTVPPGQYRISMAAPDSYIVSPQGSGSDTTVDSNLFIATGQTGLITVGSDETRTDIDGGFYETGAIGDRVWTDANSDGLQAGDSGLGGVIVRLLDAATTAILDTTTTADGTGADPAGFYQFTGIQPGAYVIEVVLPSGSAFSPPGVGADSAADSDVSVGTGRTSSITVTSGFSTADIDAGVYMPSVIGDRVWEDVNGDGDQDGGEPGLGGVTVNLLDASGTSVLSSTTTADGTGADPLGFYQFTGLAPGTYVVEVLAPAGYTPTGTDAGADNSDSDIGASGRTAPMVATSGYSTADVDGGLIRSATIGDRVWLDADGDGNQSADTSSGGEPGLAGVTVRLLDSAGTTVLDTTTTADGTGADPVGFYQFTGVNPGGYIVEIVAPALHLFTVQGPGSGTDSDMDAGTGRSAVLAIGSGTTTNDIDGGLFVPASIGDQVWDDLDGNGIQDGPETGLGGVTVNLLDATATTLIATTTTADGTGPDPIGYYLFSGLAPGSYRVEVIEPAGFVVSPANQGADDAADSDISTASGRTGAFAVTSGAIVTTVDGGLYRPGVIGDRVWEDTNANGIQDGPETGLAGVTINLLDATATTLIATTTTADGTGPNPLGHYQFTGLTPGTYRVEVIEPAGFVVSPANQGADDAADSDISTATGRTTVLTVESGFATDGVDAGLYQPASIGDRVWEDTNANGIQDGPETGLAGVTINLLDATATTLIATTTTADGTGPNPLGHYQFTGLGAGSYVIEVVEPSGYLASPLDAGSDDSSDNDIDAFTGRTAAIVTSSGSTTTDVDAGLHQPGTIGDRVWNDTNGDGIQDGPEVGLAGVTVNLLDSAGANVVATTTSADGIGVDPIGFYRFAGVAPGSYRIEVVSPAGRAISPQSQGGSDSLDSDVSAVTGRTAVFTVDSGFTTADLDAGLYLTNAIGDRVWQDTNGNGIQDSGEPGIGGVTVRLLDAAGTSVIATTTTADGTGADPLGHYQFGGLAPAVHLVEVVAPSGYSITTQDQGGNEATDSDIDPGTGRSGTIAVAAGSAVDDVDAGLFQGATIGDRVWTDTNANGIQDALDQPSGEQGLAGVTVRLLDSGGAIASTTTTADGTGADPVGYYLFTDVAPGTYSVEIVEPTGTTLAPLDQGSDDTADSDFDPATGETAPFVVTSGSVVDEVDGGLFTSGSIGDRVWEDGNADGIQDGPDGGLGGVTVNLLDATATTLIATTTTADGTGPDPIGYYLFSGLAPGSYRVEVVEPSGYLISPRDVGADDAIDSDFDIASGRSGTIAVAAGSTNSSVDVGIYQPGSIGDRVWEDLDGDGIQDGPETGLAGVTINLLDATATTLIATTTTADGTGPNPLGHYQFTGLTPGTYLVEIVEPVNATVSPANAGSDDAIDSDFVVATGRSATVTIVSGSTISELDGGLFFPATIGDRVWNDDDADGIQDGPETGLAGVTINLLDATATTLIATTTTADGTGPNPLGHYQFTGVVPGDYQLEVVKPAGFSNSNQHQGADDTVDSDLDPATGRVAITVASGSTTSTVDAGLFSGGTFGDRVWEDRNANGIQDGLDQLGGEQGLAGVTVRLFDSIGTTLIATTTTTDGTGPNPIGYYEFSGIAPGTYLVEFATPATFAFSPQSSGSSNTADSDADQATGRTAPLVMTSGATISAIDAGMYRTGSLGDQVWDDANGDGIQDPLEVGLANLTVNLLDVTGTTIVATTTTADGTGLNPIGHYQFDDVVPGSYRVQMLTPAGRGISPQDQGSDDTADSDLSTTTGLSAIVTLSSGQAIDSTDVGFYPLASVGDRIWRDDNANGIQDGLEPGLGGITVNLLNDAGTVVVDSITTADGTGPDPLGFYRFGDVAQGDYRIEVVAPASFEFSPLGQGADDSADSDVSPTTGRSSSFSVVAAAGIDTMDAGLFANGLIGDRVWEDTNGDGLQNGSEAGLAGVTVNLFDTTGTNLIATTTTADGTGPNPLGFYEFTVAPGSYLVEVIEPAGFVASTPNQGADDAVDSDLSPSTGRTGAIVVSSGSAISNVDAGLHRPGSIGDRVWDDLNGDGIQNGSEPGLAGVTVNLLDPTGTTVIDTTISADGSGLDALGYYQFTVAPGVYVVEVEAPTGFTFTTAAAGGDTATDSDLDETTGRTAGITVASGASTAIVDGGLFAGATVGDRVWVDLDRDGIQDDLGQPAGEPGAAGLTVNLLDATGTTVIASTTTADGTGPLARGEYSFTNVRPGTYLVEFVVPGFTFTNLDAGSDDAVDSDSGGDGRTVLFTVTSGSTTDDLDAGVLPATLGDRVWNDANGNGIQDNLGQPGGETGLPGLTVNLLDVTGTTTIATTTTADGSGPDPAGFYRFDVAPGDYVVEVVPPGTLTFIGANQGADDTADSDVDSLGRTSTITVPNGSDNLDIDAGLFTPATIGDRAWDDANGDGIQNGSEPGLASITVNLLDAAGTTVVATTTTADGTGSDPIGHYEFNTVAPGTYIVEFDLPPGRVASPLDQGATDGVDSDIGPDGRTAPITVSSGDTLGTVDGGSFVPITVGGRVWLDRNGDGLQDADASASGEPGLAGVSVNLLDDLGAIVATTTTADGTGPLALGEFRFTGLVPGSYEIQILPPVGHGISDLNVGSDDSIDSDINQTTALSGQLTAVSGDVINIDAGLWAHSSVGNLVFTDLNGDGDQSGDNGLGSVTVRLLDATGTTVIATTSSSPADGAYSFNGLAPGDYLVDVVQTTAPGGFVLTTGNDNVPVSLSSGQDIETVDFGFEPTGDVTILKTPDAQEVVETGAATFTITVINNGSALTGVTVSDPLAPACDQVVGSMATGETVSYSCSLANVTADFTNTATVTGSGPGGSVSASDTAAVTVLVPEIEITKSPDTQSITTGDTANFTITVHNIGDADLTNVTVTDVLAPDCDRTIASLAAGATSTATCSLTNVTADFTNTVAVAGTTAINTTVTDSDTAEVAVLQPGLTVTKTPATQTIVASGNADFTITVTNTGQTTLNNVIVTDVLTPGCDRSYATIPVGQTRSINCSLTGVAADFTNQVNVEAADPNGGTLRVSATAEVDVISPAVSIAKTPDTQGIANGGTADFTIAVTNTGDVPLTNIVVSDPLAPSCDRTIASLAVGGVDSAICSLSGVTADFINIATVVADTPASTTITDADGAVVDVLEPSISISKTPDTQTVVEGNSVDFTITVANTGDVALTGVTVSDPEAPACDRLIGALAIGAVETITCSLANVTGDFTNTATVNATAPGIGSLTESDTALVVVLSPGLDIQKSPNIQQVPNGGTATFDIRVTNAGAVDLSSVTVTDPLSPDCDNAIGGLLVGQSITYTCTLSGVTADFTNTATVDALDSTGTPLRDIDTADVDAVTTGVQLTKSPDTQSIPLGGTASFTVEVANIGDLDLTGVVVSDPAAPGCSSTIGNLAAGATVTLTCSVSGVLADFTNTADVTANVVGGGVVTSSDTGDVTVLIPGISIEKTPDTQSVITNGTATFTIAVRNTGATTVTGVTVVDPLAPSCDRAIGTLLVTESATYTCTIAGVAADFTNTATVDASDPLGAPLTDSDTAAVTVLLPSVSIAKGPNLQTVVSGQTATFTIELVNDGGVDLSNVVVDDPLTADCSTIVGTLTVGQTASITCTRTGVAAGFTNTATVTAEDALGNIATASDAAVVVVVQPGIEISKTPDVQQVLTGGDADFTIEVTNTGTELITSATVTDALAPGCDTTITNLAPGASIATTCTAPAVTTDFVNVATVSGVDSLGNPVSDADDATVDVINPAIAIAKGPDPQIVVTGGDATFTITVTNTGDTGLTAVTVSDPAAPGCDRVIPSMAAGEALTFSCTVSGVSGNFTNTADVVATDPLNNPVTASDTADVLIVVPAIEIEKSPAVQEIEIGTDVTFEIAVRNTGATNLTSVEVSDAETADCERSIGTLTPGQVVTYTCTAANVTSDFTNVANVASEDPLGLNVSDTDSADVRVLAAGIDIQKTPDTQSVVRGGAATFSIDISNIGELPLTAVTVNDPQAPGCDAVIPALAPSTSVTVTCTRANVLANFTNTASVTATTPAGGTVRAADTADITVLVPSIVVAKTPDAQSVPTNGTANFTIVATNNGQTTLTDVFVSDPLAPNCSTATPATLAPGEDLTVSCSLVVGTAGFTNVATALGRDPLGGAVSHSDDAAVVVFSAGSVDGVVFLDLDGSGGFEPAAPANEPGIGGVTVLLVDALGLTVATTQTLPDGSYTFANVPTGDYRVEVDGSDPDIPNSHLLTTANETQSVVVAEGSLVSAGPVGYTPEASIAGIAFVDVNGDGREDGTPLAGVTVTVFDSLGNTVGTTTTAADGSWSHSGLYPDTYTVRFDPPPGYRVTALDIGGDDTIDSDLDPSNDTTNPINVLAGSTTTDIDGGFFQPVSIGDTVFADHNGDGTQQPKNESGMPSVDVIITWAGPDGIFGTSDDVATTVATDGNGSYLTHDLPPGAYEVAVVPPAGTTVTTGAAPVGTTIASGNADTSLDFGLRGSSSLAGTVVHDQNGNGTGDSSEPGIGNVAVVVTWAGPDAVFGTGDDASFPTTTATDGTWSVQNLPSGDHRVEVDEATAPAGLNTVSFDHDATPDGITTVSLAPGESVAGVDTGLAVGATIGDTVFGDNNRNGVQDTGEPGLSGVTVIVTWHGPDGVIGGGDDVVTTVTTSANGTWLADELAAGTYTVSVDPTTIPKGYRGVDSTAVTIALGETDLNADIGLIPNQPATVPVVYDVSVTVGQTPSAVPLTDPNGDRATVAAIDGSVPGLTLNSDGSWSGTASTPGVYEVDVTVCDSFGDCTTHTLTIRVLAQTATRLAFTGGSLGALLTLGLVLVGAGLLLRRLRRSVPGLDAG